MGLRSIQNKETRTEATLKPHQIEFWHNVHHNLLKIHFKIEMGEHKYSQTSIRTLISMRSEYKNWIKDFNYTNEAVWSMQHDSEKD